MKTIDTQGRLFGKLNLIDAFVAGLVLVLIPLAYGAYALFRPERTRLLSVEPSRVLHGRAQRLKLRGEHLQPFLRVQVGNELPRTFFLETPSSGEVELPPLRPGTYDVTLHDEAREVARLSGAITVVGVDAVSPVTVQLVGVLMGLDESRAREVTAGRRLPDDANPLVEVISVRPARPDTRRVRIGGATFMDLPVAKSVQVPATLRAACVIENPIQDCKIADIYVQAGLVVKIPGWGDFAVEEMRPDAPHRTAEIGVRFVTSPEIADAMRAGDTDSRVEPGRAAAIVTIGAPRETAAEVSVRLPPGAGGQSQERRMSERATVRDAVVRLGADETPLGLLYRGDPLKLGAPFTLETRGYIARGTVTRLPARGAAVATPSP